MPEQQAFEKGRAMESKPFHGLTVVAQIPVNQSDGFIVIVERDQEFEKYVAFRTDRMDRPDWTGGNYFSKLGAAVKWAYAYANWPV